MEDILNTKTGQTETPKGTVEPAKVTIVSVTIKTKSNEGKDLKTPLAQFHIKHPAKEELLIISKVKFLKGEKLVTQGFWVQTDDEGNFYKGSSISMILETLNVDTLAETYGMEIETVKESDESPYLCLKAY